MTSSGSLLPWLFFAAVVISALAVDLGVFNRKAHRVGYREAATWTAVWAALAMAFNGFVVSQYGLEKGGEFFQGYILELALSVDNVFVFVIIFSYFKVAEEHLHRVLFWGIIGAVVARGAFIAGGTALVAQFHAVMYVLGAFLVYTAAKIVFQKDSEYDPSTNPALRVFRKLVPTTSDYDGSRFIVKREGRWMATPLLAVLVVIDVADVMFAIDSIPAVFGVTSDVFVILTSNTFAILGLRSLFFLVARLVSTLRFLKFGVALILAFIGAKILIESFYKMPVMISLAAVAGILAASVVASLVFPARAAASSG